MTNEQIVFLENDKSRARITVIGVGGCGGNAANAMLSTSLDGEVGIYAVNTDVQALDRLKEGCERIQIGQSLAKGLGVGGNYKIAEQAAQQDIVRIEEVVEGSDMVFIAAGMGGGTGTGASPVIAEKCKEMGILTVAVVTKPFEWENRKKNVDAGLDHLSRHVDSIIVVPNDRISEHFGEEITIADSFQHSDDILSNAVAGICEIIYRPGKINVDFADVRAVMAETGQAMMGTATESGVDRASKVASEVITCPLLEGINIANASGMLVNITADPDKFKSSELTELMNIIRKSASEDAKIFFGLVDDKSMEDNLRVTLVATGLNGGRKGELKVTTTPGTIQNQRMITSNRRSVVNSNQGDLLGNGKEPSILRRQHS